MMDCSEISKIGIFTLIIIFLCRFMYEFVLISVKCKLYIVSSQFQCLYIEFLIRIKTTQNSSFIIDINRVTPVRHSLKTRKHWIAVMSEYGIIH